MASLCNKLPLACSKTQIGWMNMPCEAKYREEKGMQALYAKGFTANKVEEDRLRWLLGIVASLVC